MHAILNRRSRVLQIAAALFALVALAASARADIFQWEYINPADPSQGKRQSTTLAPDGTDVDAVPGANLSNRNLTMAYLIGADLTNAMGYQAKLTNADLSQANLGLTFMPGVNFTGANLSHANLTGAYLGALLDEHGIIEVPSDLTSADITQADLRNASFSGAILAGADFTGAEVRGAAFDVFTLNGTRTGSIALPQLYSTASYRALDLSSIQLRSNDLHGGNFAGQNFTNAEFDGATLTGADFTGADARRAVGLNASAAATHNFISPDGHIRGLDLDAGKLLIVRDYDGDLTRGLGTIPITVDQHLSIETGGMLRIVFDADAWDSAISFSSGIPVALGGTLDLTFAADVNLASEIGRTIDLFDWTGVNPTGVFMVTSPYTWDLSKLYTTGEVTLSAVPEPADFALAAVGAFSLTFCRRRKIP
jgi:uncharacterized protein YjbI with pentapeptide repeats